MLILYLHFFQRGFEVLNATSQASVYVTAIVYYNSTTVIKLFDISLVVELLIYSKKSFPI